MLKKIWEAIRSILNKLGLTKSDNDHAMRDIPDFDNYYTDRIKRWKEIYQGNPPWKVVNKGGLQRGVKRNRKLLNVGKVVCREITSLIFSEQVDIGIVSNMPKVAGGDDPLQQYINQKLQDNGFWSNFPHLLDLMCGIGGGVVKEYLDNGKIMLDYVDGDYFIPLHWDNKKMYEGVFVKETVRRNKYYTLFEFRYWTMAVRVVGMEPEPALVIENRLFESNSRDSVGNEVTDLSNLYPGMEKVSYIWSTSEPLFTYIKPAITNNINTDVPLGMSIFANSEDTLESLDIAFDSLSREFLLGKKRIIVPTSAIRYVPGDNGAMVRYFDADDEVYQAMKADNPEDLRITDNTVALRVEEHVQAINALLNILCMQIGISPGSLSFDKIEGLKTATEVISQDSKTYRTMRDFQNLIRENIEDIVRGIVILGQAIKELPSYLDYSITVTFDDSIIEDTDAIKKRALMEFQSGAIDQVEYFIRADKLDEDQAIEKVKRILDRKKLLESTPSYFDDDDGE